MSHGFGVVSKRVETIAIIEGKAVEFDAQATCSLKEAKAAYAMVFKYVGSTTEVYYNSEKEKDGKLHHIFVRKQPF